MKKINLIGCCGIECGLCPRFQSKAKSRCLGCGPDAHCSYCSIFKCCTIKRNSETCADCLEFPCEKFKKWFDGDSFVTHQKCLPNIQAIKKNGVKAFLKQSQARQKTLEVMLEKYNPGRCASLYCLASALMDVDSLDKALKQTNNAKEGQSKLLPKLLHESAARKKINLQLRKQ